MKPLFVVTKGTSRQFQIANGSPTGVELKTEEDATWEWLTCAETIQGDFHDPNPWSYHYTRGANLTGLVKPTSGDGWAFDGLLPNAGRNLELVPPPWQRDYAYNACLGKINDKVRGTLDLGVDIAEAGQTLKMLRVMETIASTTRIIRRAGFRSWRGTVKGASSRYLEYRYGWLPLVNDLFQAADESVRVVLNKIQAVDASVTIPHDSDSTGSIWAVNAAFPGASIRKRGFSGCKIRLSYRTRDFDLARWSSLNPVSLGWEVLPYSFVVDWVYDIGGMLRGLETSLLYSNTFVSGMVRELYVSSISARVAHSEVTTAAGRESLTNGQLWQKAVQFNRSVLNSYPLPRLPSFKAELGSVRLLNAAALLAQFFVEPKTTKSPIKRPLPDGLRSQMSASQARVGELIFANGLAI